ncbi:hypothetical protein [Brevifollis gellanilyticus]|uniref:Uncharacterized protein n=1 Tax=Brevifollis gellanilyticus TaxID=748831 RepID=A0A512M6T0_9BACT|nr:hypothetical protein [Brevifollis gellanilyticus]GEP42438.1 hypothetical protein BGE01nite_17290 [Brevifollis gellanilyticus]
MPTPPKKQASSSRDLDHDGDVDLADDASNDLNRDGRIDANDREEFDLDNDNDIDAADRELKQKQDSNGQSVGASLGWRKGAQSWNKEGQGQGNQPPPAGPKLGKT